MDQEARLEECLHYAMALNGGFMGAYALLNRGEIFGSAQTANLIHIVLDLAELDWMSLLLHLGALLLFTGAIVLSIWVAEHTCHDLKKICVLLELPVVLVLGFFPAEMTHIIALYPVFFIMAFQWCSFTGLKGYTCSTTFSTNNLKQFVTALCTYAEHRNRCDLEKARIYGLTLLNFHIGVTLSFFATRLWGVHAVWCCTAPLSAVLVTMEVGKRREVTRSA